MKHWGLDIRRLRNDEVPRQERGDLDEAATVLLEGYTILKCSGQLKSPEAAQVCTRFGHTAAARAACQVRMG